MKKTIFITVIVAFILGLVIYPDANSTIGNAAAKATNTSPLQDMTTTSPIAPTAAPQITPEIQSTSQPTRPVITPKTGSNNNLQVTPTARITAINVPTKTPFTYSPVQVETMVIFSKYLAGAERIAQIYVPGEYASSSSQRYPVMYVFDGQQLPEIGFQQTLDELYSNDVIPPIIIVAIHSTEGDFRKEELGTGPILNSFGWGTESEAFNNFVINEVVTKVNNTYRTLTGPANTTIMGWSLGGLTSFYLAWQNPDIFGTVGAFSPSFWWRTDSEPGQELQARVIPNMVNASLKRPGLRMWFEAGTKELPYSDIDQNGVEDMIQDIQDVWALLVQKGYQPNVDMVYMQVEGGQHELSTWAEVLPNFLEFAYPND